MVPVLLSTTWRWRSSFFSLRTLSISWLALRFSRLSFSCYLNFLLTLLLTRYSHSHHLPFPRRSFPCLISSSLLLKICEYALLCRLPSRLWMRGRTGQVFIKKMDLLLATYLCSVRFSEGAEGSSSETRNEGLLGGVGKVELNSLTQWATLSWSTGDSQSG